MKTFKFIGAIALALTFTACNNTASNQDVFYIKGKVNSADIAYVQHITFDSINVIDTLELAGNQFEAAIPSKGENAIYQIAFAGQNFLRFMAQTGDTLNFEIDVTQQPLYYSVSGNTSSERILRFHRLMNHTLPRIDSLDYIKGIYADSLTEVKNVVYKANAEKYNSIMTAHHDKLVNMIMEDSTDLTNVLAFYQAVGQTQLLQPQYDWQYYFMVDNGIQSSESANHPLATQFHDYVTNIKQAMERARLSEEAKQNMRVGSFAPAINLPDPNGKIRSLSDLRGKIVLVDFWASWCKPCRMNNPHLVDMYAKYADKGFDIFSVGLDGLDEQSLPRQEWRNAIEQDKLTWENHVSDLKGWKSEVVLHYGVQGIPFTVLLDREGKILGTNLRGAQLEKAIQEAL